MQPQSQPTNWNSSQPMTGWGAGAPIAQPGMMPTSGQWPAAQPMIVPNSMPMAYGAQVMSTNYTDTH